jgi:carbamate kinase
MRIVIALGGNALLRRGDPMTVEVQRRNVRIAAAAIAPLAARHSIVVVHGNGPQVGLLSLQAESYTGAEPYPLDVLDAGTQGMIGYLIQQELRSLLPPESQVATLLTMIVVDPDDPAFASPAKFVGPVYDKEAADKLAADKGWTFRQDGAAWRRVVPSPEPRQILELQPITWLLEREAVVICAGGGGIPTMIPSSGPGALVGVEAVIDKDLASELLAENVSADLFLMATDVDGVYVQWGTPQQRRLDQVTPEDLAGYQFAAGSMGPKVKAAARFVVNTGGRAAIGSLADIAGIVAGTAGTNVRKHNAPADAALGFLAPDQKKAQRTWTRARQPGRHQQNRPIRNSCRCAKPRSSVSGRWWARASSRCLARPARWPGRRCGCHS